MSLRRKRKQLIAAAMAAMMSMSAGVPAVVAAAPAVFAEETAQPDTTEQNTDDTSTETDDTTQDSPSDSVDSANPSVHAVISEDAWQASAGDTSSLPTHKLLDQIFSGSDSSRGYTLELTQTDKENDTTTITLTGSTTVEKLESTYLGAGSGKGYITLMVDAGAGSKAACFSMDNGKTKYPLVELKKESTGKSTDNGTPAGKFEIINLPIWEAAAVSKDSDGKVTDAGLIHSHQVVLTFYENSTTSDEAISTHYINLTTSETGTVTDVDSGIITADIAKDADSKYDIADGLEATITQDRAEYKKGEFGADDGSKVGAQIATVEITGAVRASALTGDDAKDTVTVELTVPQGITGVAYAESSQKDALTLNNQKVSVPVTIYKENAFQKEEIQLNLTNTDQKTIPYRIVVDATKATLDESTGASIGHTATEVTSELWKAAQTESEKEKPYTHKLLPSLFGEKGYTVETDNETETSTITITGNTTVAQLESTSTGQGGHITFMMSVDAALGAKSFTFGDSTTANALFSNDTDKKMYDIFNIKIWDSQNGFTDSKELTVNFYSTEKTETPAPANLVGTHKIVIDAKDATIPATDPVTGTLGTLPKGITSTKTSFTAEEGTGESTQQMTVNLAGTIAKTALEDTNGPAEVTMELAAPSGYTFEAPQEGEKRVTVNTTDATKATVTVPLAADSTNAEQLAKISDINLSLKKDSTIISFKLNIDTSEVTVTDESSKPSGEYILVVAEKQTLPKGLTAALSKDQKNTIVLTGTEIDVADLVTKDGETPLMVEVTVPSKITKVQWAAKADEETTPTAEEPTYTDATLATNENGSKTATVPVQIFNNTDKAFLSPTIQLKYYEGDQDGTEVTSGVIPSFHVDTTTCTVKLVHKVEADADGTMAVGETAIKDAVASLADSDIQTLELAIAPAENAKEIQTVALKKEAVQEIRSALIADTLDTVIFSVNDNSGGVVYSWTYKQDTFPSNNVKDSLDLTVDVTKDGITDSSDDTPVALSVGSATQTLGSGKGATLAVYLKNVDANTDLDVYREGVKIGTVRTASVTPVASAYLVPSESARTAVLAASNSAPKSMVKLAIVTGGQYELKKAASTVEWGNTNISAGKTSISVTGIPDDIESVVLTKPDGSTVSKTPSNHSVTFDGLASGTTYSIVLKKGGATSIARQITTSRRSSPNKRPSSGGSSTTTPTTPEQPTTPTQPTTPSTNQVPLDTQTVTMRRGANYQFLVKGNNDAANITVSSANPAIATVVLADANDPRGAKYEVTATGTGTTQILVTYQGKTSTMTVNVQASKGSMTLDTAQYTMAPGNRYDIGAFIRDENGNPLSAEQVHQLVANGRLKVRDSRTGSIVTLTQLPNGNFRITGRNEGTAYIIYEMGGTHASVRVDVQRGAKQGGSAVRNTSYFTE